MDIDRGNQISAASLVAHLGLTPHPEGGYFRETYRAGETVAASGLPARFGAARSFSTAIYYLLEAGQCSRLHRLKTDEIFHFYAGDPLIIVEITKDGALQETRLGTDFTQEMVPQHVIAAGNWFGAAPAKGSRYSLVGCTVAPGFDFADFEMAARRDLLEAHPRHADWITRLT
ncbi:MAG TPA: cupin domain-containing protein [Dongiaceae bacterium]